MVAGLVVEEQVGMNHREKSGDGWRVTRSLAEVEGAPIC